MARRFHRARHHAGRAASGWKGSLMGLGGGAVISFGTSMATSRVDFLKASQNWWATPAILAVLGHFLKNKSPALGYALLGIAGAVGVENFTHSPTNAAGWNAPLGGAGGYNDNQLTDASPGTNAALNGAAALVGGPYGAGAVPGDYSSAGMLYSDGGSPVGASGWGDYEDMMGLQD